MTPDWERDGIALYCGDCLDVLPQLDAGSVDAVVTDPPYGIGYKPDWKRYDGSPSGFSPVIGDDKPFDPTHLLQHNTLVIFGANYFHDKLPLGGWICWDKSTAGGRDRMFGPPFELAWYRSGRTSVLRKMVRVLHRGIVNADSTRGNNQRRWHPTQKPTSMWVPLITDLTAEDDTVCDPYMGVGGVGCACVLTGHRFVGIEIDQGYFDIAVKRIEAALRDKAEQLDFAGATA